MTNVVPPQETGMLPLLSCYSDVTAWLKDK